MATILTIGRRKAGPAPGFHSSVTRGDRNATRFPRSGVENGRRIRHARIRVIRVLISRHVEVGGWYQLNRIRTSGRGRGLDAHVIRLRLGAPSSARLPATGLLQLSPVDDRLGVNLRPRYDFREGSEVWLVYDEGLNPEREQGTGPSLPLSDVRALRLKLTHTFTPW